MTFNRRLLLAVAAIVPLLSSLPAGAKGGMSGGRSMGMSRSISTFKAPAAPPRTSSGVVSSAHSSGSTSSAAPSTGSWFSRLFGGGTSQPTARPAPAVPAPLPVPVAPVAPVAKVAVAPSAPAVAAKPFFSQPTASFFNRRPATSQAYETSAISHGLDDITDGVVLVLRSYGRGMTEIGFSCAPTSATQTALDWKRECQINGPSLSRVFSLKMRRNCTSGFGETAHRWAERCAGVTLAQMADRAQASRGYSQGW